MLLCSFTLYTVLVSCVTSAESDVDPTDEDDSILLQLKFARISGAKNDVHDCFDEETKRLKSQQISSSMIGLFGLVSGPAAGILSGVSGLADIVAATNNAAADNCMQMGFNAVLNGQQEIMEDMRNGFQEVQAEQEQIMKQQGEMVRVLQKGMLGLTRQMSHILDVFEAGLKDLQDQLSGVERHMDDLHVRDQAVQLDANILIMMSAYTDIQSSKTLMLRNRGLALQQPYEQAVAADHLAKSEMHTALQASFSRSTDAFAVLAAVIGEGDYLKAVARRGLTVAVKGQLQGLLGYCGGVLENQESIITAMRQWFEDSKVTGSLISIAGTMFNTFFEFSSAFGHDMGVTPSNVLLALFESFQTTFRSFSEWIENLDELFKEIVPPLLPMFCPLTDGCRAGVQKYPVPPAAPWVQVTTNIIASGLYTSRSEFFSCDQPPMTVATYIDDTESTVDKLFWGSGKSLTDTGHIWGSASMYTVSCNDDRYTTGFRQHTLTGRTTTTTLNVYGQTCAEYAASRYALQPRSMRKGNEQWVHFEGNHLHSKYDGGYFFYRDGDYPNFKTVLPKEGCEFYPKTLEDETKYWKCPDPWYDTWVLQGWYSGSESHIEECLSANKGSFQHMYYIGDEKPAYATRDDYMEVAAQQKPDDTIKIGEVSGDLVTKEASRLNEANLARARRVAGHQEASPRDSEDLAAKFRCDLHRNHWESKDILPLSETDSLHWPELLPSSVRTPPCKGKFWNLCTHDFSYFMESALAWKEQPGHLSRDSEYSIALLIYSLNVVAAKNLVVLGCYNIPVIESPATPQALYDPSKLSGRRRRRETTTTTTTMSTTMVGKLSGRRRRRELWSNVVKHWAPVADQLEEAAAVVADQLEHAAAVVAQINLFDEVETRQSIRSSRQTGYVPKDDTAAVRCCTMDGESCMTTDIPNQVGCIFDKTSDEAISICAASGMRLCTAAEINLSVCCETGCGLDDHLIWVGGP